jgi:hypothetical protein
LLRNSDYVVFFSFVMNMFCKSVLFIL